jgi:hypothetical protein
MPHHRKPAPRAKLAVAINEVAALSALRRLKLNRREKPLNWEAQKPARRALVRARPQNYGMTHANRQISAALTGANIRSSVPARFLEMVMDPVHCTPQTIMTTRRALTYNPTSFQDSNFTTQATNASALPAGDSLFILTRNPLWAMIQYVPNPSSYTYAVVLSLNNE